MKIALTELSAFAADTLAKLPRKPDAASLLFLSGELGAGKTTFMQAAASVLRVRDPVVSPTYVLMKSYPLSSQRWKKLVHVDLYRLEKTGELAALKLKSVFSDSGSLVVIEWPERAEGKLPKPDLSLTFSSENCTPEERFVEPES